MKQEYPHGCSASSSLDGADGGFGLIAHFSTCSNHMAWLTVLAVLTMFVHPTVQEFTAEKRKAQHELPGAQPGPLCSQAGTRRVSRVCRDIRGVLHPSSRYNMPLQEDGGVISCH